MGRQGYIGFSGPEGPRGQPGPDPYVLAFNPSGCNIPSVSGEQWTEVKRVDVIFGEDSSSWNKDGADGLDAFRAFYLASWFRKTDSTISQQSRLLGLSVRIMLCYEEYDTLNSQPTEECFELVSDRAPATVSPRFAEAWVFRSDNEIDTTSQGPQVWGFLSQPNVGWQGGGFGSILEDSMSVSLDSDIVTLVIEASSSNWSTAADQWRCGWFSARELSLYAFSGPLA